MKMSFMFIFIFSYLSSDDMKLKRDIIMSARYAVIGHLISEEKQAYIDGGFEGIQFFYTIRIDKVYYDRKKLHLKQNDIILVINTNRFESNGSGRCVINIDQRYLFFLDLHRTRSLKQDRMQFITESCPLNISRVPIEE